MDYKNVIKIMDLTNQISLNDYINDLYFDKDKFSFLSELVKGLKFESGIIETLVKEYVKMFKFIADNCNETDEIDLNDLALADTFYRLQDKLATLKRHFTMYSKIILNFVPANINASKYLESLLS